MRGGAVSPALAFAIKRPVEKLNEAELLRSHPISGLVPGWFFRVVETSNMAWVAEGKDHWGRTVSCRGSDDGETLKECAKQAEAVNEQLAKR